MISLEKINREDTDKSLSPESEVLIQDFLADIYHSKKVKPKAIERLRKTIKKHQKCKELYDLLAYAYSKESRNGEAMKVIDIALERFPKDLDLLLQKANLLLIEKQADQISNTLGEALELEALYPEKTSFSLIDVQGFYEMVARYFIETQQAEKARDIVDFLQDHKLSDESIDFLGEGIDQLLVTQEGHHHHHGHDHDCGCGKDDCDCDGNCDCDHDHGHHHDEPEALFQHEKEIDKLYEHAILTKEHFQRLLKLPRKSLIADLELVLEDSKKHFEEYLKESQLKGWSDNSYSFPLHAMLLLSELESEKSLPVVLDFLSQPQAFVDFWLSDLLFDLMPTIIYKLGKNQPDVLKAFMLDTSINSFHKGVVSTGYAMVASEHPEKRTEVLEWFKEIMEHYLSLGKKHEEHLREVLSQIGFAFMNIQATELVPIIQRCYEAKLMDPFVLGKNMSAVRKAIAEGHNESPVLSAEAFYMLYESLITPPEKEAKPNLAPADSDYPEISEEDYEEIGRNDPCPCGSGKKFKKCCM